MIKVKVNHNSVVPLDTLIEQNIPIKLVQDEQVPLKTNQEEGIDLKTRSSEIVKLKTKGTLLVRKASAPKEIIFGHGLKVEESDLGQNVSVDLAEELSEDNTLPISSASVYKTVGNIEVLLETI